MFGLQMFNEIENLQREMDQIFRGCNMMPATASCGYEARYKVRDVRDAIEVQAPLPGIDLDSLEINILGRQLKLNGTFADVKNDDADWHRQERPTGGFKKTIDLLQAIDIDKVEAEYSNGILKINLPKAASALPKKISVKVT